MDLLDVAMFDSDDADRLSAFSYGMRLTWEPFKAMVEARLDFAAKHHLIAGYLLHGWTGGVVEESGTQYGALDAQRMLSHIIEGSQDRGMISMTGDQLYRWWTFRRATQIELADDTPAVVPPGDEFEVELEILPPFETL